MAMVYNEIAVTVTEDLMHFRTDGGLMASVARRPGVTAHYLVDPTGGEIKLSVNDEQFKEDDNER